MAQRKKSKQKIIPTFLHRHPPLRSRLLQFPRHFRFRSSWPFCSCRPSWVFFRPDLRRIRLEGSRIRRLLSIGQQGEFGTWHAERWRLKMFFKPISLDNLEDNGIFFTFWTIC